MPGFDGTGPSGRGPLTGWRRGFCSEPIGPGRPRFEIYGGYGGGRGRGWRNRYWSIDMPDRGWWRRRPNFEPELTKQEEIKMLKEEAESLESELEFVNKEIEKLKKTENKNK